jgi:hypothetical protein
LADEGSRFGESGVDLRRVGDVHLAEYAADLGGYLLAVLGIQIKNRDFHTMGRQLPSGGGTQARSATGDDGGEG